MKIENNETWNHHQDEEEALTFRIFDQNMSPAGKYGEENQVNTQDGHEFNLNHLTVIVVPGYVQS